MSEFPPGSFDLTERIMHQTVAEAHREAHAHGLQRQAAVARGAGHRLCCAILVQVGQRLVAWGAHLQERYSTNGTRPTPARAG
jgi:hypothetical protein